MSAPIFFATGPRSGRIDPGIRACRRLHQDRQARTRIHLEERN